MELPLLILCLQNYPLSNPGGVCGEKHEAHGDVVDKHDQGRGRLFASVILLAFTAVLQATVDISIVQIRKWKL